MSECPGARGPYPNDSGSPSPGSFSPGFGAPPGGIPGVLVKAALLAVLLVAVVGSNIVVILKVTRRGRKWTASDRLFKTLAWIGILNGLVNVSTYLVTTCTALVFHPLFNSGLFTRRGHWVLGGTLCQFHGVFGTVIINAWTWILALAAFERFVKLLVPGEHASFFSEVNTKIMTWGAILLLFVMYLGPVYGWGEYSYFRGKLDLSVGFSITNTTAPPPPPPPSHPSPPPSSSSSSIQHHDQQHQQLTAAADHQVAAQQQAAAMGYLAALTGSKDPLLAGTMLNLTKFFETERQIHLRRVKVTAAGLVLPMRAVTRVALQCLWAEFEAGWLAERLQGIIMPNATLAHFGVPKFELQLSIEREQYVLYSDVHIPYQESATCSLDYSSVNEHVYSFVGFTWLCNLLLPLAAMTYFYARLYHARVRKLCMFPRDGISPEDAIWCRVYAYTGFASMLCHMPFVLTSLSSGCGFYVPALVHFVATYLVYFSTCLLAWFYLCSTRASTVDYDGGGVCGCFGRGGGGGVCCCWGGGGRGCFKGFGSEDGGGGGGSTGLLGELHQRLLARPRSAGNSPYKQRAGRTGHAQDQSGVNETEL